MQVAFSSRETIFSQKKALNKLQKQSFGEQNRAQIEPSSLKIAVESEDRHRSFKKAPKLVPEALGVERPTCA